ncbi:MAG: PTS-dependent dihydroxyacetone kinase phosphotransferase subunit DhaM [Chloroflexi bacterium]|nr:MAG: PTS-dependent dihydroxyacetone kinase phosphotransferase subunit DhaM [Chloroflexota bacterium]
MIGIVLVSHSHLQARGLQEMAEQLAYDQVKIVSAGGIDENTIGTNAERIFEAIQEVYSPDGVLVFFDLGSALLSTQMAIEMLPPDRRRRVQICDAPMVEGVLAAVVEASLGHPLEKVCQAAQATRESKKIP